MKEKIKKAQSLFKFWAKIQDESKRRFEVYKSEINVQRTWFHIDMDMFFAACELRDQKEL